MSAWFTLGLLREQIPPIKPRRAALDHLQNARGQSGPDLWLGSGRDAEDCQYVYLTEPDTILQMRPSAMESIQNEMNNGDFLVPIDCNRRLTKLMLLDTRTTAFGFPIME